MGSWTNKNFASGIKTAIAILNLGFIVACSSNANLDFSGSFSSAATETTNPATSPTPGTPTPTPPPLPPPQYSKVSAGKDHACAIESPSKDLYCWGMNTFGKLGTGSSADYNHSRAFVLAHVTQVSAGQNHTCALVDADSDGYNESAFCWGSNQSGQLGDNTFVDSNTPQEVIGTSFIKYKQISVGLNHTCAVVDTSTKINELFCWGDNNSNQSNPVYGTSGTDYKFPVDTNLNGVLQVLAFADNVCALKSSGEVLCWGSNLNGRNANGITDTGYQYVPFSVKTGPSSNLFGTVHISKLSQNANDTVCAISDGGATHCWGKNNNNIFSTSSTSTIGYATPMTPEGTVFAELTGPVGSISTLCGIEATSNKLSCWGQNSFMQLGDGSTDTARSLTNKVQVLTEQVSAVSAGHGFTCAITDAGNLICWGLNDKGQLGNGTLISTPDTDFKSAQSILSQLLL